MLFQEFSAWKVLSSICSLLVAPGLLKLMCRIWAHCSQYLWTPLADDLIKCSYWTISDQLLKKEDWGRGWAGEAAQAGSPGTGRKRRRKCLNRKGCQHDDLYRGSAVALEFLCPKSLEPWSHFPPSSEEIFILSKVGWGIGNVFLKYWNPLWYVFLKLWLSRKYIILCFYKNPVSHATVKGQMDFISFECCTASVESEFGGRDSFFVMTTWKISSQNFWKCVKVAWKQSKP